MRHIVTAAAVTLALLLVGCKETATPTKPRDPKPPPVTRSKTFSPPAWIQGTWKICGSEALAQTTSWTFTADNVVSVGGDTTYDWGSLVPHHASITDESGADWYAFTVDYTSDNPTGRYLFARTESGRLAWTITYEGRDPLPTVPLCR